MCKPPLEKQSRTLLKFLLFHRGSHITEVARSHSHFRVLCTVVRTDLQASRQKFFLALVVSELLVCIAQVAESVVVVRVVRVASSSRILLAVAMIVIHTSLFTRLML